MSENKSKLNELKNKMRELFSQPNNENLMLSDTSNAKKVMIANGINNKIANQIGLIFECSNIKTYLKMEKMSVIEANNCLNEIVSSTDLNRRVAKELLSVVLFAFGFQSVSDELDKLHVVEIRKNAKEFDLISPSQQDSNEVLKLIEQYVDKKDTVSLGEKSHELEQFVKEGDAYALFIKGKCYLYGIGTTADANQARRLLERSASKGFAKANSLLGDLEFENRNYTKAYDYYTGIGAVALSSENQNKLLAILDNKKINLKMYVGSIIIFALTIIFDLLMATGHLCPSGCTHYPSGIISILLTVAVFVLIVLTGIFKKYDSPRLFLLCNSLITSVFTFIALVI